MKTGAALGRRASTSTSSSRCGSKRCASCSPDWHAAPRGGMRLLSYNIHKGIGGRDRRYRIERVIEVIELENPDLVCLQEVAQHSRRAWRHDQPRLLADYFHPVGHLFQRNV